MLKASLISGLGSLLIGSAAFGVTATYNVAPGDLATGKPTFSTPHGQGTNPFAYDWDSAAPGTAAGAPAGFGTESFYASVSQSGATTADRYRTFRVGLRDIFGQEVTIGEIKSISYQTNKDAGQTTVDWRTTIYTTPGDKIADPNDTATGTGDRASWYRNRLQSFPQQSDGLNAPANTWNTWTTDDTANQMIFETNRTGFTANDIQWSDLTAGTVTRGASTWDFSGEEIMMLDLTLGANTGGGTAASALDGFRIELVNGDVAFVNAVPEPTGLALIALGGIALLGRRGRRTQRVSA